MHTFTSYGRGAGSARVRIFDWLDWTGLDAVSDVYLDTSNNSLRTLGAAPLRVLTAELRLRQSTHAVENSTVLISRQASPLSNGIVEERLLTRAEHGVYDFDDALMHSPPTRTEALWSKRKTWARATSAADIVIAGNDYLADQASSLNGNVVIIPSCVNPNDYAKKAAYEITQEPRAVWLGSPSTEHYLQRIAPALLVLNKATGLRLTLISVGEADLGLLQPMVDRVSWTLDGFAQKLKQADFGIMPLDDNEWTRGKCAYKLLQYGASALPLIGSPVGANAPVLAGAQGFAAVTVDDWVSAMETVAAEPVGTRRARGQQAFETVNTGYSFAAWETAWRAAMALHDQTTAL